MKIRVQHTFGQAASRFERYASTEARAEVNSAVMEATNLVYQQARENIATMFKSSGRMQNALRIAFDGTGAYAKGSVSIEGVAYSVQEFGGTRPYAIFPSGRALKFQAERFFQSREMETVFAPMVIHPPLPERSFLRKALDQKRAEIAELFGRRVRAIFER